MKRGKQPEPGSLRLDLRLPAAEADEVRAFARSTCMSLSRAARRLLVEGAKSAPRPVRSSAVDMEDDGPADVLALLDGLFPEEEPDEGAELVEGSRVTIGPRPRAPDPGNDRAEPPLVEGPIPEPPHLDVVDEQLAADDEANAREPMQLLGAP